MLLALFAMNKVFVWTLSVALAGFLFGFDTVVISGADKKLQELWNTSDVFHGFVVMASALWGTVIGAMTGGIPTNKYGRKKMLILIGVLYIVSAVGAALANDPISFAIFRFIGGLGIGASTIAAPGYISEIAPAASRGRLVTMYQLAIVVGILTAFLSNYLLRNTGDQSWRWMIGVAALPSVIYTIAVLFIPNSPRWLVMKGREEEAREVYKKINSDADTAALINDLRAATNPGNENIFMMKYRRALLLAFFIAFFNQFSGINAILYYAPRIFEAAGLGSNSALLSSAGVGLINVIFTLIGMMLIDRLGRKQLMYIGSVGYIISLALVACAFYFGWQGISVPVFLFAFIAAHAIGQGAVIWVFIAELFPTHLRPQGEAFGSSVHWVLAAAIPSMIPVLFTSIGAGTVFVSFALMMIGQLIWVRFKMPETKGLSLEEVSRKLTQ